MSKKKGKRELADQSQGFQNAFGDLLLAAGIEVTEVTKAESPEPAKASPSDMTLPWHLLNGAQLRIDRKGRRGKTVTLLTGVEMPDKAASEMSKALGKSLGCRGFIEDGQIVLQGDHTKRIGPVLASHDVHLSSKGG